MAMRRRRTGSRKANRGWLWLVVGLALGAGVMYGTQHWVYKDSKPFASLAKIFSSEKKNGADKPEVKVSPFPEKPAKPKLDFYTILPGETLLPEPRPDRDRKPIRNELADKGSTYVLQAAAYAHAEDADRLKAKLALSGLEAHIEKVTVGDKGSHFRVRLGPYPTVDALDTDNNKLSKLGIKAMRLKVQKSAPRR